VQKLSRTRQYKESQGVLQKGRVARSRKKKGIYVRAVPYPTFMVYVCVCAAEDFEKRLVAMCARVYATQHVMKRCTANVARPSVIVMLHFSFLFVPVVVYTSCVM